MTENNVSERTMSRHNGSGDTPKKPPRLSASLEAMRITDGPVVLRKPALVTTAPSVDLPEVEEVAFEEGTMVERPTEFEPRQRRVSDVIDSSGDGNSLPSSPRRTTFAEQMQSYPAALSPDWLNRSPPLERGSRVNDSTDAALSRDLHDAKPMASSTYPVEEEDDDRMPRDVVAYMPVEKDSHEYNMSHARRGRAVIFNHDTFEMAGYGDRPGSDVDAKNLEATFLGLHFEVSVYHNLEYAEIMAVINSLRAEDHSNADCLAITVLSHGMNGGYVLSKDVPYSVDKLWQAFRADACITLAGKPKLFFIQACRGEKLDSGVHMMRKEVRTQTDSAMSDYKIPSFADILIAYSTVDGHYAWRNPETGTWFVQCLCLELRENGTSIDLLSLLTRTARRVALDFKSFNDVLPWQHDMKQVPSISSMLIREVHFRPKVVAMATGNHV